VMKARIGQRHVFRAIEVQFPPMRSCAVLPEDRIDVEKAELPEFIPAEYLADGSMEAILIDRTLPRGALYFITPSARARPAKVEALWPNVCPSQFGLRSAKNEAMRPTREGQVRNCSAFALRGCCPSRDGTLLYKRRFQAQ
jgi:hypothetical protein